MLWKIIANSSNQSGLGIARIDSTEEPTTNNALRQQTAKPRYCSLLLFHLSGSLRTCSSGSTSACQHVIYTRSDFECTQRHNPHEDHRYSVRYRKQCFRHQKAMSISSPPNRHHTYTLEQGLTLTTNGPSEAADALCQNSIDTQRKCDRIAVTRKSRSIDKATHQKYHLKGSASVNLCVCTGTFFL